MTHAETMTKFNIASGKLALGVLRKRLGTMTTVGVIANLAAARAKGEPWRGMPAATSDGERMSRQQIAGAVLLFRELKKKMATDQALEIMEDIVRDAAVLFLKDQVPVMARADVAALPVAEQRRMLREIAGRFPNGETSEPIIEGMTWFGFDVTHCRFPGLCRAVGAAELAPLFCAGDKLYFDRHQPDIEMRRAGTIAEGAPVCDFRFYWRP